ncbi:MAG: hypothetical protein FD119_2591 [Stygiobacter sp.]|nr:MAG: hypothetical protein FD119_2591 [Stygiobacter sp.]
MAGYRVRDRTGERTPPLPCTRCRDLFPMEILTWSGKFCECRPECDAERADATARCTNCGTSFQVGYADEGSLAALDEWSGGEDPCRWHVQIWNGGDDGMSILLPDDIVTAENQWLADIGDLLENDAYKFPSPKDQA